MSTALIELIGVSGKTWVISGPGMGEQGVELARSPGDLHDEAPFKTIWQQSVFQEGATYLGRATEPIDLVLGFNINPTMTKDWLSIESEFFADLDTDPRLNKWVTIRFTAPGGKPRTLKLVKFEKVKTDSKIDPNIYQYSNMVVTLRAPWPFWEGETVVVTATASRYNSTAMLTLSNPTDRPIWIKWVVSAPGTWRIPDYDLTGRGVDAMRRVITPNLLAGQDLTIDTNPLNETYVAADGTNISGLFGGVDFLYPLPPHTGPTTYTATYDGDATEAGIQARLVHNWKRAWGGA